MRMRKLILLFAMLFAVTEFALAQQRTVKGTVFSSEDGQPIFGAYVWDKDNQSNGTTTDIDGKFTLKVSAKAKKLVFSFLGMETKEVNIKNDMKVVLDPSAQTLDDVVIVGYGSGKKIANTTASIVKVSSKDLQSKPVGNPIEAIQGKVAGIQMFTNSGEPSRLSSITIHGPGTIGTASTDPLYILDGVPTSYGTIQSMNPNDFESVQVLKDASATSIYGSRASNGVIYITTKRGLSSERATITVSGMYGISNVANTSYFDRLMSAEELLNFYESSGIYSKKTVETIKKTYGDNDTKWYKYFLRENRPTYSGDVSISGGTGKTSYYISSNLFSAEGLKIRSHYKKYGFRANINTVLNKYARVSLRSSLTLDDVRTNKGLRNSEYGGGLAWQNLPWYSPYKKDGSTYGEETIPGYGTYSEEYRASKFDESSKTLNSHTVGSLILTPTDNLRLNSTVALEVSDYTDYYLRLPSHIGALGNGSRNEEFSRNVSWTFTNTAEYSFKVSKENNFNILLGHEFRRVDDRSFGYSGNGIADDRLVLPGNITKDKEITGGKSGSAYLSFFGRLSYDYANKYFIDATLRSDASSKFAKENRNAIFWSAGLMWKLKNENFLKDVSWINAASVKLSTGTTGNQSIADYTYLALSGKGKIYMEKAGLAVATSGNPNLTWEKQRKTTLGIDVTFLNRLTLNAEIYDRLTTDMLMNVPSPGTAGFNYVLENVGEYQNRGIDLRLDADIFKNNKGDFLSAYVSFNYNKDKVTDLFRGLDNYEVPGTGIVYKKGQPVQLYYPLFKWINPKTGLAEWYERGEDRTVTQRDDSKVTNKFDREALSQNTGVSRYAPINGGFGLNAQFKGFYMQADFTFSLGKHIISNDLYFSRNPVKFSDLNQHRDVTDYWKKEGDIAKFPRLYNGVKFMEFDDRMLLNSSFARLKNLTIGYSIPNNILAKQNILKGAKIFFTARNMLTFTSFEGLDPEIDANLTVGANPNTKQFSMGMELKF